MINVFANLYKSVSYCFLHMKLSYPWDRPFLQYRNLILSSSPNDYFVKNHQTNSIFQAGSKSISVAMSNYVRVDDQRVDKVA